MKAEYLYKGTFLCIKALHGRLLYVAKIVLKDILLKFLYVFFDNTGFIYCVRRIVMCLYVNGINSNLSHNVPFIRSKKERPRMGAP